MSSQITRSSNGIVGGVCAGLAKYAGIDPIIVRIVFLLAAIYGGSGVLLYIVLWVLMPDEKSTDKESKKIIDKNSKEIKQSAEKLAEKAKSVVNDKSNKIFIGIAIIIFGSYLLLANLGISRWINFELFFSMFWPLFIVAIGIILIIKKDGK